MASPDQGRFVLVRSDHLVTVIDKPNVAYVFGRGGGLPASQQFQDKYASREQFSVTWQPPVLRLRQLGKNPTFHGPQSAKVPSATDPVVEFQGSSTVTAPTTQPPAADGRIVVAVPLIDPIHATSAPPLTQNDAATLFFPAERSLPCIAIRCERTQATAAESREGANAATSSLSAAQMLAVPGLHTAAADSDSDEEADGTRASGNPRGSTGQDASASEGTATSGKPEWKGLLDAALQQQQQRQEVSRQRPQEAASTPSRPSAPLPPAPSSTPIPAPPPQPASPPATAAPVVPATSASAATPPSKEASSMGFWEWKCHANGKDSDPKSWRKYPLAAAKLLEEAYRAKKVTVSIPDSALGMKDAEGRSTYSVCFKETSLDGAMIQYQASDPGKFRLVRRKGGEPVDWSGVKGAEVIPATSSGSSSDDSSMSSDDDESDFSESESESVTSSSSSDSEGRKKKRRRK